MEVVAVEGSYASVIGGAPAAAVVFAGDVSRPDGRGPSVRELEAAIAAGAEDAERGRLRAELADVRATVRSEKLGEVAAEFDGIHSVQRAVRGRIRAHHHPGGAAPALSHRGGRARYPPRARPHRRRNGRVAQDRFERRRAVHSLLGPGRLARRARSATYQRHPRALLSARRNDALVPPK